MIGADWSRDKDGISKERKTNINNDKYIMINHDKVDNDKDR
jgi:hypothetical protein